MIIVHCDMAFYANRHFGPRLDKSVRSQLLKISEDLVIHGSFEVKATHDFHISLKMNTLLICFPIRNKINQI